MSETTPRPGRRRGGLRRARALGAGAAAVLAVVALGATTLPPAGETVIFSPGIPQADTPEVAVAPTGQPEPTETAEETPSPMPEPDAEPTAAPELAPEPSPTPTPSVEPEVEPESDSEREARSRRNGAPLWGRRFVGVSVTENGQPRELVPGTEIRVVFDYDTDTDPHEGGIGWYGGCSGRSSRLHVEPDRLIRGEFSWGTLRGCLDAEAEQEAWLGRFLRSNPFWRVEGERLWLWSEDTIIEWVEDHRPPENR